MTGQGTWGFKLALCFGVFAIHPDRTGTETIQKCAACHVWSPIFAENLFP